jgi:hypothetical protein
MVLISEQDLNAVMLCAWRALRMLVRPPKAASRCCDADAACSGRMLDVCIFSNNKQVTIHLAKKDVSILTPQV